jgi:hypothetical protein
MAVTFAASVPIKVWGSLDLDKAKNQSDSSNPQTLVGTLRPHPVVS